MKFFSRYSSNSWLIDAFPWKKCRLKRTGLYLVIKLPLFHSWQLFLALFPKQHTSVINRHPLLCFSRCWDWLLRSLILLFFAFWSLQCFLLAFQVDGSFNRLHFAAQVNCILTFGKFGVFPDFLLNYLFGHWVQLRLESQFLKRLFPIDFLFHTH